jgi:hypothetical protein
MAKPSPLTWVPLLERALREEIGIAFPVSGVTREYFRNQLYEARNAAKNPAFDNLIIFLPNDNRIWICRKAVELDDATPSR